MLSFVWFLTAHILVYTSVKSCRFAAPHLWWLSFGIMCILYFMIVEVFLVGLVVFIFWPAFWVSLFLARANMEAAELTLWR